MGSALTPQRHGQSRYNNPNAKRKPEFEEDFPRGASGGGGAHRSRHRAFRMKSHLTPSGTLCRDQWSCTPCKHSYERDTSAGSISHAPMLRRRIKRRRVMTPSWLEPDRILSDPAVDRVVGAQPEDRAHAFGRNRSPQGGAAAGLREALHLSAVRAVNTWPGEHRTRSKQP